MTRQEAIKVLEEAYRLLQEEVDLELTDYAREEACGHIDTAIQYIQENEKK